MQPSKPEKIKFVYFLAGLFISFFKKIFFIKEVESIKSPGKKLEPEKIDATAKKVMKSEAFGGLYVDAFIPPKELKIADHVRIDFLHFPAIIAASEEDKQDEIKRKCDEAITGLKTAEGTSLFHDATFISDLKENLNLIFTAEDQAAYNAALKKIKEEYPYLAESQGFPAAREAFTKKPVCALKFLTAAFSYKKRNELIHQILVDLPRNKFWVNMNLFGLEITKLHQILYKTEKDRIGLIREECTRLIYDPEMVKLFGKKFIADLSDCLIGLFALYENNIKEKELIKNQIRELFPYLQESKIDSFLLLSEPQAILKFLIEAFIIKAIEKMPLEASYSQAQGSLGILGGYLRFYSCFLQIKAYLGVLPIKQLLFDIRRLPKTELKQPSEEAANKFYFDVTGRFCIDFLGKTEITFLIKNKYGTVTPYKMQFYIHEKYHLENGVYVLDEAIVKGASANPKENVAIEECVIKLLSIPNPVPERLNEIEERPLDFVNPLYTLEENLGGVLLEAANKLTPCKDDVEKLSEGGLLAISLEGLKKEKDDVRRELENNHPKIEQQSQLMPVVTDQVVKPAVQEPPKAKPSQPQPVRLSPLLLTKEKRKELDDRELTKMATELNGIIEDLKGMGDDAIKNAEETKVTEKNMN